MKKLFEKHDLVKMILITIVFVAVLTWIIPGGVYQSGTVTGTLQRTGFADLFLGGMMSISFFLQQILFVLIVGAFYGVLIKVDGYKKLVETCAKKMKGHEIPFVLITSLLITGFTSITTNIFVVFLFIPFIISIARKMNLDNLTSFAITFGSMLIGILGATYGTEGLISFVNYLKYYTTATIDVSIAVRAGILLLAYVLFNFFNVTYVKKTLSKKDNKEEKEDLFAVEESKKKKVKTLPVVIGLAVLLIFVILGFIDWETNFNISIFTQFHEWLLSLQIGEYTVISYILGENAAALGAWQLYHIIPIMALVLVILTIIYRVNFDSILDGINDGIKKVLKLVGIITLIYVIFVFMYWSPIVPTITSWIVGLTDGFNPFLSTIAASISAFFHSDFGYAGYALGDLFSTYEGNTFNVAFIIYSTMNGFINIFAPTSAIAMMGLAYCNIPYKKWFSYIWKFLLGMLACLLVIFALLTYL